MVSHRRSPSAAGQLGAEAGQSGGPGPAAELPAAGGGAAGQARAALGRCAVRAARPRPALRPRAPRTHPTVPQNARTMPGSCNRVSQLLTIFCMRPSLQCPTRACRPVANPSSNIVGNFFQAPLFSFPSLVSLSPDPSPVPRGRRSVLRPASDVRPSNVRLFC